MDNGVDEDLIEATIRRVAEAKAAQARDDIAPGEPQTPPDHEPLVPPDQAQLAPVDEDAIEATIRRVAEARAARQDAYVAVEPEPATALPGHDAESDRGDNPASRRRACRARRGQGPGAIGNR